MSENRRKLDSAILSVGTELLMGSTVNTNSAFLSRALNGIGISVLFHQVVGDNDERLLDAMEELSKKVDLIVFTGGLGPTRDDITKATISRFLHLDLYYDKEIEAGILRRFAERGREMPQAELRQAYMPEGSIHLKNDIGTAPGVMIEHGSGLFALLPGPPREMETMFNNSLRPELVKRCATSIHSEYVKIFGMVESRVEEAIMDLVEGQSDPTIATYVGDGEVLVRVTSSSSVLEDAKRRTKAVSDEICRRLEPHVFSREDKTLEQVFVETLSKQGRTFSAAESCTGGLVSYLVTSVSGSSAVLDRSYVTYSNEAKVEELGVSPRTLRSKGAVSEETAMEMAQGVFRGTGSDFCISVTGIAGPDGGSDDKPVGLVYIGLHSKDGSTSVIKHLFGGSRSRVRILSAKNALFEVLKKSIDI